MPDTVTLTPPPPAQPAPSEEELARLRQELKADVQQEATPPPTEPPPNKAEVPPSPTGPPPAGGPAIEQASVGETPPGGEASPGLPAQAGGEAEQIQRIETAVPTPQVPTGPATPPPTPLPDTAEDILEETEKTYEERAKGSPEDARTWDAVLNLFKRLRERVMGSKRESSK